MVQLSEQLSSLTKKELTEIRQELGIQGASQLKKDELVEVLAREIPQKLEIMLYGMTEDQYEGLKKMEGDGGYAELQDLGFFNMVLYRSKGLIFVDRKEEKHVWVMSREIQESIKGATVSKEVLRRNSLIRRYTKGMLWYYGIIDFSALHHHLETFLDEKLDRDWLFTYVYQCGENEEIFYYYNGCFVDTLVIDNDVFLEKWFEQKDLSYKPYSKSTFYNAGVNSYLERTPELQRLEKHLLKCEDIREEQVEDFLYDLVYGIQTERQPVQLVQELLNDFDFASKEELENMISLLTNVMNTTPLWMLKGYTPNELLAEEKKHLRSLPKIGRNESCSCGSGKKYKKCCG